MWALDVLTESQWWPTTTRLYPGYLDFEYFLLKRQSEKWSSPYANVRHAPPPLFYHLPLFTCAKISMSNYFNLLQHEDKEESLSTVLLWELNITTKYSPQCESGKPKQNSVLFEIWGWGMQRGKERKEGKGRNEREERERRKRWREERRKRASDRSLSFLQILVN